MCLLDVNSKRWLQVKQIEEIAGSNHELVMHRSCVTFHYFNCKTWRHANVHEIAIMQHSQSFAEEGGGKGKIPGYSTIFSLEPVSFEN